MLSTDFAQADKQAPSETELLRWVGNTPLLRLERIGADLPKSVEIYGKAEWFNPGGSVKDRPALNMLLEGERSGRLSAGKTILDATSGNTGIAYAWIAARKGYKVKLALPLNASHERKRILKAYGVELILTDPTLGSDGAIQEARRLFAASPEAYFYPDQYSNDANWQAHYLTTGVEIYQQTAGRVTHFVAGLGTSGTCMGVGRRLREYDPAIEVIAMQPDSPFHGLEGLKHMETAIVPAIYDDRLPDRQIAVSTEQAQRMVKRLAREEGLLVGISAGANVVAALQVARAIDSGVIVTILCDGADKYLSERFWDDPAL
ncbi:PLP-dependent cysteine synthase family protein [Gloeobacter kilaueensis]|uniref:Cysteine synthase B n=1 Tax=Gloeobacter kilaueensis (strain ATCC BAA-2537 / CCAP 1431/1 / ULC 316 / JS1) TaxID=1183438 RepID=U5QKH1_GLOK1|nr:cysteine synthase family protein [Gloeobacter kilaueensis]AGY58190.1 cysteine synthase B [Gloeobacter kilaueensis JS1]